MEMPAETIPEDIRERAENCIPRGLDGNHYRSTLRQYIEAALMERDKAATERAARMADDKAAEYEAEAGEWPCAPPIAVRLRGLAAAIRSQP